MIIQVKQKHIDDGEMANCIKCPVALALRDVFPNCYCGVSHKDVFIGDLHSNMNHPVKDKDYHVSRSVFRFISNFDTGKPVKPFNFRLTLKD